MTKNIFCYRDLALAVSVVLPPWESFFDFSFPSYGRFREGTPPMRQNVRGEGRLFVTSEGFSHENGHNSETKCRKMLPKVPKRPEWRGLGPYSKKPKFLGQNFCWPFLAFFGQFLVVFGRNFMKERHLSKKCFLTFVQIVKDYIKRAS